MPFACIVSASNSIQLKYLYYAIKLCTLILYNLYHYVNRNGAAVILALLLALRLRAIAALLAAAVFFLVALFIIWW